MKGFATSIWQRAAEVLYNRLQDVQAISPAPQVAKFKTGHGVSRTEIHRGSREATASHREKGAGTTAWPNGCRAAGTFHWGLVPWSLKD